MSKPPNTPTDVPFERNNILAALVDEYHQIDAEWSTNPNPADADPDTLYGRPLDKIVEMVTGIVPRDRRETIVLLRFAVNQLSNNWDVDRAALSMIENAIESLTAPPGPELA